ncbi:head-tail connector protein [Sphingomonas qomolangmaensis]|uniref:PhiE125 gp8 family phage protein n=1 Tax=Sphingomonas qomolangmaensis TaxID=2918765 RepID=A0ABY5L8N9_9SPHN|nr:hypothetical protein [Sphingomonas qomolangmaensis]UUL82110.1 hypothetical protein NMP03_13090 [Sphingomonas qomolangmaensis]
MTTGTGGPGGFALGEGDRAAAVAQVRALLRSDSDAEDALLGRLIDEGFALAELFTGQVLIARAVTEAMRGDGTWQRLRATPVRAVTGVADADGAMLPVERYAIDIDAAGDGWVRVRTTNAARMVVTLAAGLADDWSALPPGIAGGIVRLAAHRFGAREEDGVPPAAVAALWRPWRRIRLHDVRVPA